MPVSDHDLETLETWLDGELAVEHADELRRRLSAETDLAQAVDRLRADRQVRAAIWQTMEPAEAQVEAVVKGVRTGIRKDEIWTMRFRVLRSASAIAASIVLVFAVGWISRDRLHVGPANHSAAPTVAVNNSPAPTNSPSGVPSGNVRLVGTGDPRGSGISIPFGGNVSIGSNSFRLIPVAPNNNKYTVSVTAPNGKSYTEQFDDLNELEQVHERFVRALLQGGGDQQQGPVFVIPGPQSQSPRSSANQTVPVNAETPR
jgi:hypothetical protein